VPKPTIHATLTGLSIIPPGCAECITQTTIPLTYDPAIDRWTGDITFGACTFSPSLHLEFYCFLSGGVVAPQFKLDTSGCSVNVGLTDLHSPIQCNPLDAKFVVPGGFGPGQCCSGSINVEVTV